MTAFSNLAPEIQWALAGLFFISVMSSLALFGYKCICTGKLKNYFDLVFFIILLVFQSYISAVIVSDLRLDIPFIIIILASLLITFYSGFGIFREYKKSKNSITPRSIKQALDNLNLGVCFSDDTGRIVLINHTMGNLISSVINSYPQTLSEIEGSLNGCEKPESGLYRINNGVWRFDNVRLSKEGFEHYTQTTATDVTELFLANEELENDNEALKKTNEEMQKVLLHLADRIREQETLNIKMRIHDDIGSSLIAITKIMTEGEGEDVETQLDILQSAVSYFSNDRPVATGTFKEAQKSAERMHAKIVLDGVLPSSAESERIIADAARECVTNCINHAAGDTVFVKIEGDVAIFTNNGTKPKEKIQEGGGLSSLRKEVEAAKGEMEVLSFPEFKLIIDLSKRG